MSFKGFFRRLFGPGDQQMHFTCGATVDYVVTDLTAALASLHRLAQLIESQPGCKMLTANDKVLDLSGQATHAREMASSLTTMASQLRVAQAQL